MISFKLIALAAMMFLVCSVLDKIPDWPELLPSPSASALVNPVHHASAVPNQSYLACGFFSPSSFNNTIVADLRPLTLPRWVIRAPHQAADLSPPQV